MILLHQQKRKLPQASSNTFLLPKSSLAFSTWHNQDYVGFTTFYVVLQLKVQAHTCENIKTFSQFLYTISFSTKYEGGLRLLTFDAER